MAERGRPSRLPPISIKSEQAGSAKRGTQKTESKPSSGKAEQKKSTAKAGPSSAGGVARRPGSRVGVGENLPPIVRGGKSAPASGKVLAASPKASVGPSRRSSPPITDKGHDSVASQSTAVAAPKAIIQKPQNATGDVERIRQAWLDRTVVVFFSSTFKDYNEERDELHRAIFPQLQQLCAEQGLVFVPTDLRWGITAEDAGTGKVLDICLQEISRSTYFVGMYAERYGWHQPPSAEPDRLLALTFDNASTHYPWLSKYRDRSVTEMEYRHAALNDTTGSAKPFCLFYFRDPSFLSTVPADQRPFFASESPLAMQMLTDLKQEVKDSGYRVVENYPTPKGVAETVLRDLSELIQRDFPTPFSTDPMETQNHAHEAFLESRCRVFVKRPAFSNQISQAVSAPGSNLICITASSGSGKTALLANWVKERRKANPGEFLFVHFIGGSTESATSSSIVRRLLWYLSQRSIQQATDLLCLPPSTLDTEFTKAFPSLMSSLGQPAVLVFDALDQLADTSPNPLSWLPTSIPASTKIICSALQESKALLETLRQRGVQELSLSPLQVQEREDIIRAYLLCYGKRLDDNVIRRIASDTPCSNALFLRTLLDELKEHGRFETLANKIDTLLKSSSPEQLFEHVLSRWEEEHPKAPEFLGLLCTARHGLSEPEAREILGLDSQPQVWTAMFMAMRDSLVLRAGLIAFFHKNAAQASKRRYYENNAVSFHGRLCDYFLKQGDTDRKIEELPWHLQRVARWDDLARLLTSIPAAVKMWDRAQFDLLHFWQVLRSPEGGSRDVVALYTKTVAALPQGDSFTTAKALRVVGLVLEGCQQVDAAQSMYQKAVDMADRLLANQKALSAPALTALKSLYVRVLDDMARVFKGKGQYQQARPLYEKALKMQEELHGKDHADVAACVNNLAVMLSEEGKFAEAKVMYERSVGIAEKIYGKSHAAVGTSLSNLANVLISMGDIQGGMKVQARALAVLEQTLGPDHPHVAASLANLGGLYSSSGRPGEARQMYEKALKIMEKAYGDGHVSVATMLSNLGSALHAEDRLDEALKLFDRAIGIVKKVYGEEHPDIAMNLSNKATVLVKMGKAPEALELANRAHAMRLKLLDKDHPDVVGSFATLAGFYYENQDYEKALGMFEESIRIQDRVFGPDHPDLVTDLLNAGMVARKVEKPQRAWELYERAERTLAKQEPRDDAAYFAVQVRKGLCLVQMGKERYGDATALLKVAVQGLEKAQEPDESILDAGRKQLAELLKI